MGLISFGSNGTLDSSGRIMDRTLGSGASLEQVSQLIARNGRDDVVWQPASGGALHVLQADNFKVGGPRPKVGDALNVDGVQGTIRALGFEKIFSAPNERSRYHHPRVVGTTASAVGAVVGFVTANFPLFVGSLLSAAIFSEGGARLAETDDARLSKNQADLWSLQVKERNVNQVYGE